MKRYRAYIFDLDGTLYRGHDVIPHAVETVMELRKQGALIRFLTNNSSQTSQTFVEKLGRMGFEPSLEEVYSSASGTASLLRQWETKSAFVVGMPGLVQTLRAADIEVVNTDSDDLTIPSDTLAEVVTAGICLHFNYQLLSSAMQQIRQGAKFVATNPDTTFPLEGGRLTPGAGSLVASLQACSGVEPFVVGKPNPYLIELILKDARVSPEECLVVGDRLDTDIESGIRAGCDTHLVLTGVESSAPSSISSSPDLRGLLLK